MPNFLLIDTSTKCCSVAIAENDIPLIQKIKCDGYDHASLLPTFVDQCLQEKNFTLKNIDAIAISIGPGSYTGLRVGLSFAKALCFANQIPLITISTLEMMTYGMMQLTNNQEGFYIPMIDARRMEVYTATLNEKIEWIEKPTPTIITNEFINEKKINGKIFVGGDGAFKLKSVMLNHEVQIIEELICEAKYLAKKTNQLFSQSNFADLAYSEPVYLKQFAEVI
ncbi:MAG: hypothetical protein RL065_333 [Bacteroidota bacterium]|jgi:tRNA threonylcarbamoyladenosine biosynthesis protein TsaB